MYSLLFVCLFYRDLAHHLGPIPITLGGDPDRRSGIWIQNINLLKYVIVGEPLVIKTCISNDSLDHAT